MKKTYLLLLATIFSMYTIAQVEFEQGTFLLEMGSNQFHIQNVNSWEGGIYVEEAGMYVAGWEEEDGSIRDVEFNDIYDKYSITEFKLNVKSGYFITDGLVVGLAIGYASKSTNKDFTNEVEDLGGLEDYNDTESELVISPMIRYYFGESGVWTSFSYGIATINMDDSEGSFDDEEFPKRSAINLMAGYAISLNDYISLNPMIGYQLTTQTTKDAGYNMDGEEVDQVIKSGSIGIGFSLTAHLSRY